MKQENFHHRISEWTANKLTFFFGGGGRAHSKAAQLYKIRSNARYLTEKRVKEKRERERRKEREREREREREKREIEREREFGTFISKDFYEIYLVSNSFKPMI
jgi:hypothetical protein